MNYTTQTQNDIHDIKSVNDNKVNQSAEMLELFAEELPTQQDHMMAHCVGTVASASTAATSTVGTLSTFGTL